MNEVEEGEEEEEIITLFYIVLPLVFKDAVISSCPRNWPTKATFQF